MNSIALIRELLAISSVSGDERKIGEFLRKRLEQNFTVTIQSVGDRFNILACCGEPRVLLTTHIDTVPGELEIREDEEWLYGRGACDTKGIIAAMICASERAAVEELTGFGLLFDVSEETDFSGITKALSLVSPEIVIVGEPTNFSLGVGQKGLLGVRLRAKGIAAPGATPEFGKNAINSLIEVLEELRIMTLPETSLGRTTFNIGMIKGGVAANVVPAFAEAVVEFRTTTKNKEVLALLGSILNNDVEVVVDYSYELALLCDMNIFKSFGLKEEVASFFTEMYFWAPLCKAAVFGPGNYCFAHGDEEKIRKEDVIRGEEEYLRMLRTFLTKDFLTKEKLNNAKRMEE